MPKRTSVERISDSQWQLHKDKIKQLYLEQNKHLTGPNGVVETMEKLHNFRATKSQYETQFKKWDLRKNRSASDWKVIAKKVETRKRIGKDTNVFHDGELIQASKIRKETSRYGASKIQNQSPQAGASPHTPEGFSIQTPAGNVDTVDWSNDLPFLNIECSIQSNWSRHRAQQPFIDEIASVESDSGTMTQRFETVLPSMRTLLPPVVLDGFFETQLTNEITREDFNTICLKWLLFSAANNFTAMAEHLGNTKIGLLKSLSIHQISHFFESTEDLGTKSLAQNLFKHAIIADDSRVVDCLLKFEQASVSVNDLTCEHQGVRCTSVELASYFQNTRVTKILVEHGADVHKTHVNASVEGPTGGALQSMISGLDKDSHANLELALILLRAGARPEYPLLLRVIREGHSSLSEILVRAGQLENQLRKEADTIAQYTVDYLKGNAAGEILNIIVGFGFDINSTIPHHTLDLKTPLESAVASGDLILAKKILALDAIVTDYALFQAVSKDRYGFVEVFLAHIAGVSWEVMHRTLRDPGANKQVVGSLSHGLSNGKTLLALAVHFENRELTNLLLELGVDVDGVATYQEMRKYGYDGPIYPVTAYSEAIRQKTPQFATYLERRGALRYIKEESTYDATLCAACETGESGIVQWLLRHGVTIKGVQVGPDFGLRTQIHAKAQSTAATILTNAFSIAVRNGHKRIVDLLLDAGAEVHSRDLSGALRTGDLSLVRLIRTHVSTIPLEDLYRDSCEELVEWGDRSIFTELFRDDEKCVLRNCLVPAIQQCKWDIVQHILDTALIVDVDEVAGLLERQDHVALQLASESGIISLVQCLLQKGVDPCCSVSLFKAMSSNIEIVHMLLAAYVQKYPQGIKDYGAGALRKAILEGEATTVRLLVSNNVDINGDIYWDEDSFEESFERRFKDYFKNDFEDYFEVHVDIDMTYSDLLDRSPLGVAIAMARNSSSEAVAILLEHGTNPNSLVEGRRFDMPPRTALQAAISTRNTFVVELLIKYGADVNLPAMEDRKRTPLQHAAEIGDYDNVQFLLNHGARVNDTPAHVAGGTSLQLAAIKGFFGILWLLLENGADVNALPANVHGRTALEGAAEYGRIDTVQLLINVGADIEGPRGLRNGLAMQLAEENGHLATLELLKAHLMFVTEQASRNLMSNMTPIPEEDQAGPHTTFHMTPDEGQGLFNLETNVAPLPEEGQSQVDAALNTTLGQDLGSADLSMNMDIDWPSDVADMNMSSTGWWAGTGTYY